jgi:hypothetical protein
VRFGGGRADAQAGGDLAVGHAASDEGQHLALPLGDAIGLPPLRGGLGPVGELLDQARTCRSAPISRSREVGVSAVRGPHISQFLTRPPRYHSSTHQLYLSTCDPSTSAGDTYAPFQSGSEYYFPPGGGSYIAASNNQGAQMALSGNLNGNAKFNEDSPFAALPGMPVNTLAGNGALGTEWADAILTDMNAPLTAANVQTMIDWFANEGIPHDLNNPMNSNTPYDGSVASDADGDPTSDNIQAYPTAIAGAQGEANNLLGGPGTSSGNSYTAIVANLQAGIGLEGSAANSTIAQELLVYSGTGYDSIPAAYCPCAE